MIKTPYLAVDGIIKLYDKNENFRGIVFKSKYIFILLFKPNYPKPNFELSQTL